GSNDPEIIANKFAAYFETVCTRNCQVQYSKLKNQFQDMFSTYKGDVLNSSISIDDVAEGLSKLQCGKSAGPDKIDNEHLIHAHPCLHIVLSILFNNMLESGYVPEMFCQSVIILLLKDR